MAATPPPPTAALSQTMCRICALEADDNEPLFDGDSPLAAPSEEGRIFENCLAGTIELRADDGFPRCICDRCNTQLRMFNEFRRGALRMHKKFADALRKLKPTIKIKATVGQPTTATTSAPVNRADEIAEPELGPVVVELAETAGVEWANQDGTTCADESDASAPSSNVEQSIALVVFQPADDEPDLPAGDEAVPTKPIAVDPPQTTADVSVTQSSEVLLMKLEVQDTSQQDDEEEFVVANEDNDDEVDDADDMDMDDEAISHDDAEESELITNDLPAAPAATVDDLYDVMYLDEEAEALEDEDVKLQLLGDGDVPHVMLAVEPRPNSPVVQQQMMDAFYSHSRSRRKRRAATSPQQEQQQQSDNEDGGDGGDGGGDDGIACQPCGKRFKREANYRKHTCVGRTGADAESAMFKCDQCPAQFPTKQRRDMHSARHTNDRPVPCDRCDKHFKNKYDLKVHQRGHDQERRHVCPICGNTFRAYTHLKNHIDSHAVGNNYACTFCDQKYKTQITLTRHIISMHTNKDEFVCLECGKAFGLKFRYERHLKIHERKREEQFVEEFILAE